MKGGILLLAAFGQTFDAASVKPSPPRFDLERSMNFAETTGRIAYSNVTLKLLVSIASGFDDDRISGGGKWIDTTLWDVTAVFPAETSKDGMHAMLRSLLAERFGLATHTMTKDMPAYALVVGRKGHKLKTTNPGEAVGPYTLPGEIIGSQIPVSLLAGMVGRQVGRPVIDKTGIAGEFNIDLKWTPDTFPNDAAKDLPAESIHTALTDQLGLELRPATAAIEFLIVDNVSPASLDN